MHIMRPIQEGRPACSEQETIALSGRHLDYLDQAVRNLNPDMPASFGMAHLIRTIIDRVEESGIDLTDASSEEDIARLAAGRLNGTTGRSKTVGSIETAFASSSASLSAARRSRRSSLPVTDRLRPGRTPRSGRG